MMLPPGTPMQHIPGRMGSSPANVGTPIPNGKAHGTPTSMSFPPHMRPMGAPAAPTGPSTAASVAIKTQDPQFIPRDAKLTSILLNALGIDTAEPQVIPMILEFMHRYTLQILQDAQVFAEHAGRSDVNVDDVKLAISSRLGHSFLNPPPKDFMLELAEKKNSQPLPLIPEKFGIRLPPERYCLTSANFQIIPKDPNKEVEPIKPSMSSKRAKPLMHHSQLPTYLSATPNAPLSTMNRPMSAGTPFAMQPPRPMMPPPSTPTPFKPVSMPPPKTHVMDDYDMDS